MQSIFNPYMHPALLMLLRNAYYSTAANPKSIVRCVYLTFNRYPMLYRKFPALLWSHGLPMNAFLVGAMAVSILCFLHTLNLTIWCREDMALGSSEQGFVKSTAGAHRFPPCGTRCGLK